MDHIHVSHMNESHHSPTEISVDSDVHRKTMSRCSHSQIQVSQMDESFLTYASFNHTWAKCKLLLNWMWISHEWVSSQVNEFRSFAWVGVNSDLCLIWMRHITNADPCPLGCVSRMNESCRICTSWSFLNEWVFSHVWVSTSRERGVDYS